MLLTWRKVAVVVRMCQEPAEYFMDTVISNLHTSHASRHQIIPIRQMRKQRHREVENLPEATL